MADCVIPPEGQATTSLEPKRVPHGYDLVLKVRTLRAHSGDDPMGQGEAIMIGFWSYVRILHNALDVPVEKLHTMVDAAIAGPETSGGTDDPS